MCASAGIAGVSPKSGAAAHQVTIGRRPFDGRSGIPALKST